MHFRLYLSNGMTDHFEIIVALSKETSVLADVMFKMQDVPSLHSVGHILLITKYKVIWAPAQSYCRASSFVTNHLSKKKKTIHTLDGISREGHLGM